MSLSLLKAMSSSWELENHQTLFLLSVGVMAVALIVVGPFGISLVKAKLRKCRDKAKVAEQSTDEALRRQLEADGVDYVRLVSSNLEGMAMAKTVPVRHIKNGHYFHNVACYNFLHCGHSVAPPLEVFPGFQNLDTLVAADSYRFLEHASEKCVRVAQIYSVLRADGELIDPREICQRVLGTLRTELSAEVVSAVEHEFFVFRTADGGQCQKAWTATRYLDAELSAEFEPFMFECESTLRRMAVDIEQMGSELAPAQMEFTTRPMRGISAADGVFNFRHVSREVASKYGLKLSFATAPLPEFPTASGAHLNFSLWSARSRDSDHCNEASGDALNGTNLLFDASDQNGLSKLCRHVIAGLLAHAAAICAFANPLENCYRRIKAHSWAPGNVSWGLDNRSALVRVKNDGDKGTYIEWRLPGPASNPYLVLAATVVAALDGVRNELPLPTQCGADAMDQRTAALLPQSLEQALAALQRDDVLVDALGRHFCTAFIAVKRFQVAETKSRIQDGMSAMEADKLHILQI